MSRIEAAAPRVAMDMQMAKMAEKAKQQERPMKAKEEQRCAGPRPRADGLRRPKRRRPCGRGWAAAKMPSHPRQPRLSRRVMPGGPRTGPRWVLPDGCSPTHHESDHLAATPGQLSRPSGDARRRARRRFLSISHHLDSPPPAAPAARRRPRRARASSHGLRTPTWPGLETRLLSRSTS